MRNLKRTAAAALAAMIAMSAHAEQVVVEGNRSVDASTIAQAFEGEAGQATATDGDLDRAVKQLFGSGYFDDVRAVREAGRIRVSVVERPIVSHIVINGNSRLKDEALKAALVSMEGTPYAKDGEERDKEAIRAAYARAGRPDASVVARSIVRDGNLVDIEYRVDEGGKVGVDEITFTGNASVSAGRLKSVISTREGTPLSLLTGDDIYDDARAARDAEAIADFYRGLGYIDVMVSPPAVSRVSKGLALHFSISEGRKYRTGEVVIEESDGSRAAPKTGRLVPGQPFSPQQAARAAAEIETEERVRGQKDVSVAVRTDRQASGTVNVAFAVGDAERIYVERIEISGNDKTADYVIRREIDISEGDLLRKGELERSRKRIERLGFFKNVSVTAQPGSAGDRAVVVVKVEEDSSGAFEIGGGYSTTDGPMATLSFSERNFMGKGRGIRASAGRGIDSTTFNFGLTEPYLFGTRITGSADVFRAERQSQSGGYHPYDELSAGARFSLAFPLTDDSLIKAWYAISSEKISGVDAAYAGTGTLSDPNLVQEGDSLRSALGYQWTYDSFDSRKDPRSGFSLDFSQEFAGVGGDVSYLRTEAKAAVASEVDPLRDVVAHLSAKGGAVKGIGQDLAFTDHFRPGSDLVRGFANGGMGPRDFNTGFALGGQFYAGASAEAKAPTPLVPAGFGLKSTLFADVGTVFSADPATVAASGATLSNNSASIRASVGTGVVWDSPVGPIRADLAYPVLKQDGDKTQLFTVSGGTRF